MTKWNNPIDELRWYLKKGKPRIAWQYAQHTSMLSPVASDATFWANAIEAGAELKLSDSTIFQYRARAEVCANFTDTIRGHIARSFALYYIRCCEFDRAQTEIEEMRDAYKSDANHSVTTLMVSGVLACAKKQYDDAVELHNQAETAWDKIYDDDEDGELAALDTIKIYFLNRYYRLRAEASVKIWYYGPMRADALYWTDRDQDDRTRKTGAWLAVHFGGPGIRLFDRIIEQRING